MRSPAQELARTPAVYPQKLDLLQDRVLLISMAEGDYRAASFLDDRILSPSTRGSWQTLADFTLAARQIDNVRPLHFIFHSGHVGSTLISRLLDEAGHILPLREPLPLRTLAELNDALRSPESLLGPGQFDETFQAFLRCWGRGFDDTQAVVLKCTSATARLASELLLALPPARAIYLNLQVEPYLATLLAGANAMGDLRGHAQERLRRLHGFLAQDVLTLHKLSAGELAAMSWLAERITQRQVETRYSDRVLSIDFDAFLANMESLMSRIVDHFALDTPAEYVKGIAQSPVLSRYSKAPEQFAYSPQHRREILERARREHALEIQRAISLLDGLGKQFPAVADVL
jgi:hypothetical protein